MDIKNIKKEFPIFKQKINGKPLVYLDSANSSQKPKVVIDKISSFYETDYSNVGRSVHTLAVKATNRFEATRDKIQKYLLKLKDSFLDETEENRRMLDIYVNYIDGKASNKDIEEANYQLKQVLRSLGLGILVVLPFSPISIPYVLKKAKEFDIELIPDWYKALSKDKDELE